MEPATWGIIGTLIGAIIGAFASIATTIITNRNAIQLQKDADSFERMERSREFQRANLLEVQDAIQDAMRFMGKAHFEDLQASRDGIEWGKGTLNEETDESIRLANRKLSALIERVSDDPLRNHLKDFHAILNSQLFSKSEQESKSHFDNASQSANQVMQLLGEVLRKNY